ncbi:hypothetical protein [Parabacteroides sp.]
MVLDRLPLAVHASVGGQLGPLIRRESLVEDMPCPSVDEEGGQSLDAVSPLDEGSAEVGAVARQFHIGNVEGDIDQEERVRARHVPLAQAYGGAALVPFPRWGGLGDECHDDYK